MLVVWLPSSAAHGWLSRRHLSRTGPERLLGPGEGRPVQPADLSPATGPTRTRSTSSCEPRGPMVPTRLGNYATTSYPIASRCCGAATSASPRTTGPPTCPQRGRSTCRCCSSTRPTTADPAAGGAGLHPRRMAAYAALVDAGDRPAAGPGRAAREFDLMAAFASPLPIAVMTSLLGLPDEPRSSAGWARPWPGRWTGSGRWSGAYARGRRRRAARHLRRAVAPPGAPNPATTWSRPWSPSRGTRSPRAELAPLVRLLLIAGFETTVNAIGNGVRWLLADREQWQLLVEDPTARGRGRGGAALRPAGAADRPGRPRVRSSVGGVDAAPRTSG